MSLLPPDPLIGWVPFSPCVICEKPSDRWEGLVRLPMVPCTRCRGQFCHLHRLTHLCMAKAVLPQIEATTEQEEPV